MTSDELGESPSVGWPGPSPEPATLHWPRRSPSGTCRVEHRVIMISHDTFNEHVLGIIISSSWVVRQDKRDISVDKCRGAGNSASSQPSGLADERGYTRPSYCCGRMCRYEWADVVKEASFQRRAGSVRFWQAGWRDHRGVETSRHPETHGALHKQLLAVPSHTWLPGPRNPPRCPSLVLFAKAELMCATVQEECCGWERTSALVC